MRILVVNANTSQIVTDKVSAQARASATCCCCPSDSVRALRPASSCRPAARRAASACTWAWPQGVPRNHKASATERCTVVRSMCGL